VMCPPRKLCWQCFCFPNNGSVIELLEPEASWLKKLILVGPELELILELLEGEQKELLVEIRHTDTTEFRAAPRGTALPLLQAKQKGRR